jgi:L-lysine exporter family protein LysE/ArgO
MNSFAAGALLCASLIAAIGPQNLHVLRVGLSRRHVTLTVVLCVAGDALLIALALGGSGLAPKAQSALQPLLLGAGGAVLLVMAAQSLREALQPAAAQATAGKAAAGWRDTAGRTVAVTFANPAVWIETLLVVGAAALALPNGEREAFALGALAASSLWFSALGWGARLLAPWLARPAVLRALALASAAMMAGMALRLLPVWRAAGTGVL